ncbi:MAG: P1 family peptidase [Gemmatimonadales bacterium]|nr:P1 family peptidase [Gemmatimonadales bacterium]
MKHVRLPAVLLHTAAIPALLAFGWISLDAQSEPRSKARARDIGVPFDGTPGRYNAITDVAGVEVGHTTIISGEGALVQGRGPVRTGITAVLPRGRTGKAPVFGGWFSLNGNGEMTGTTWLEESGVLEGPVLITNTHSVGVARDATIQWMLRHHPGFRWALPVVAETWDGVLNDINGFHVTPAHVFAALDGARGGRVAEGAIGGGTGMLCNGFKGGIGSASRLLSAESGGYMLGVLVQCNYGSRRGLRIAGVPVGQELLEPGVCVAGSKPTSREWLREMPRCGAGNSYLERPDPELGSIIIVIATDAPVLPHQLRRIVKRASLGLGREGSISSTFSGDIFIAFSTANVGLSADTASVNLQMIPNERLDPLFEATVQATEEAVTNAMIAAVTMTGADSIRAYGLPHDRLSAILRKYNRLAPSRHPGR